MGSIIGNSLKLSVFGESHGGFVGGTLDGLPSGKKIDFEHLKKEMKKRRGDGFISTNRIEEDEFEIVSGVFNGYTTGMPLTILIKNKNTKSKDYDKTKNTPRPSHADYTAYTKYNGFNDYRGGGHFSGRLTAPIVALGSICSTILKEYGVSVYSHIKSIGNISSTDILDRKITNELIKSFNSDFPVIDKNIKQAFIEEILEKKENGNSVGGSVQTIVIGLKIGYGSPIFDSVESNISRLIFSVPAIKAIEFGKGFQMSHGSGVEFNDCYEIVNGEILTSTNNNGGINGGISNGNDIVFTSYFKPTPSISTKQKSIDLQSKTNTELEIIGRHDPCIAVRGAHVVNNVTAFGILDIILSNKE